MNVTHSRFQSGRRQRLLSGFFAAALLFAVTASRTVAAPRPMPSQSTQTVASAHRLFVFHSGLWINLHHFLYEQAAIGVAGPNSTPHEAELARDESMTSGLSEDERKVWLAAVAYYRANMLQHDLLSDPMMNRLKDYLEDSEGSNTIAPADFDSALIDTLNQAAPIYRAHWWPDHDHANRFWISAVGALVDQYGDVISQQIAHAFEAAWQDSLRVDVVAYANFAGSYTTLHPSRITVSSVDGGNQEIAALEVLFHAASATLIEQVNAAVAHSFAAAGKTAPPELSEAMLFFTSGYYVKQLYAQYTPYAEPIRVLEPRRLVRRSQCDDQRLAAAFGRKNHFRSGAFATGGRRRAASAARSNYRLVWRGDWRGPELH